MSEIFTGSFTQQEPIPEAAIEAAVAVMRHGAICEIAPSERLFEAPEHEYTQSLLRLMPRADMLQAV